MIAKGRAGTLVLAAVLVSAMVLVRGGSGMRAEPVRVPVEPLSLAAGSRLGGTVAEVYARTGEKVVKQQMLVRFDAAILREQRQSLASALEVIRAANIPIRLPDAARRIILDSNPEVVRAEEHYVAALAAFERTPNDGQARLALDRAATARMRTRRRVGELFKLAGKMSSTVSLIESRLGDIDKALMDTEVRAPADAVVDLLDVHPGDRVLPGQPVVTLIDATEYFCEVVISSKDAPRLQQAGTIGKGILVGSGEAFEWRAEAISRRTIPFVLRESRDKSEEWILRIRFSAHTPWTTGLQAELQTP